MKFVPFRSVFPRLANERGVVLVVVLWLFIFLFVVALDFSATMREDAVAAQRFGEDVEGYYLALAGLTEGLYDLLQQPTQGGQSGPLQELADGVWTDGHLGTGLYRVRLVDEGGKININRADEGLLRRVFTNLGIEEQRVHTIVDSILDWRDADDLHRVNGAENEYYLAQAYPYSARNGPFDMIEDLLWVRGVSPELFYGLEEDGVKRSALKDVFTVDSQLARVNLRTARAPILHALLGVPLQEAERFVEERRKLSEKTFADLVRLLAPSASGLVQQYFVFVSPSVVSIEAAGVHEGSQTERRIKAVVRLTGANRNVEILRWLDEDSGSENRKQE
jgi:general secretion pathway protein K